MKTKDYLMFFDPMSGDLTEKEKFINQLSYDLETLINTEYKKFPENWNFHKFKQMINQINQKFWAISNRKNGVALTKELWEYFYGTQVIPLRKIWCPEEHKKIELERELKSKGQINF